MNDKSLLRRGLIGSVFAAICCFTPLLVVVVAGVGLSALVGWLDYALFPLLFASMATGRQARALPEERDRRACRGPFGRADLA